MIHRHAICLILALCVTAAAIADDDTGSSPGVVDKVKDSVVHGAEVTGKGIDRGAKATVHGVERGADATAKGLKKGMQGAAHGIEVGATATEHAMKKAERKVSGDPAPGGQ